MKRLTQFFIWSVLFLLLGSRSSQATINYVDVPDQTISAGQFVNFDLDNDSSNDIAFTIGFSGTGNYGSFFKPTLFPGTATLSTKSLSFSTTIVEQLAAGEIIDATGVYTSGNSFSCVTCIKFHSEWPSSATDVYVGFKFSWLSAPGVEYYGWVRLDVNMVGISVNTVTVKDFGWNDVAGSGIVAGDIGNVLVSNINVYGQGNATTISTLGGSLQMFADILPTNATNPAVNWSVDNGAIASINSSGLLTAQTNGTVTVIATSADASGVSGTEVITITNQFVAVSGITVQGQGGVSNVTSGSNLQMEATVTPGTATNPTVSWTVSSLTGTASIDPSTGILTGTLPGTVEVTATATDGSLVFGSTIITVDAVLVTSISVQGQGGQTNVSAGSTLQMEATVLPANATDPSVTWSVVNQTGSATVDPNTGILTAGSPGTVQVVATANDGSGITGSTIITIDAVLVTSISVQGQGGQTNVSAGSTLQMEATVLPANATDPSVT
ncbi:MAG: Ig-like domain-containing protein, partial [Saprospiraceae bacterium]|nr:Ig-like domain-containing protein [Saprospiraceae bacterium]